MNEYYIGAALLMGLAGSLHCVGMCGPLITMMPYNRSSRWKFFVTKSLNHLGRLTTYTLLGALFGLMGKALVAAGLQQWLSIVSGVLILLMVLWPKQWKSLSPKSSIFRFTSWIKAKFSTLLKERSPRTLFMLGVLNGLLPCGLLYMALAASISTGSAPKAAFFMFLFGVGTIPALALIGIFAHQLKKKYSFSFVKISRVLLVVTALLLIVRGSNLGIPYLSPQVNSEKNEMECCQRPAHY
jgi:sulfite exporter TauE/SafE